MFHYSFIVYFELLISLVELRLKSVSFLVFCDELQVLLERVIGEVGWGNGFSGLVMQVVERGTG